MPVAPPQPKTPLGIEEAIARLKKSHARLAYGSWFEPTTDERGRPVPKPDWMIEAQCCRATAPWNGKLVVKDATATVEGTKAKHHRGLAFHLRRFIELVWGPDNPIMHFQFNPNAAQVMDELFVETPRFLGLSGHKSSGKTQVLSVIAVALFLVNPFKTKCIATSYTIQTGEDKIFGVIKLMWQAACHFFGGEQNMPGKLKSSEHKIVLIHASGFVDDTKGIELIAGEQAKSKKSSARLQGIKAEYIFIAADELATLSHAIVKTCKENIATSNKNVWVAGSFNPDHYYDGAMEMAKPIGGWGTITVEHQKWKTLLGDCLHFDGLKSPNVLEGYERWRGLYTREQLMKDREWYGGEKTHGFWQMIRAFWSPTGKSDAIYSGQEIELYHGDRPCGTGWHWAEKPRKLAGLDPSFRPGGDRAVAYFSDFGEAVFEGGQRRQVFEFKDYVILAEDVTKGADKPLQVAQGFKDECEKRGILPADCGIDCTGAAPFASLMRAVWSDGFIEIIFSESASDAPISNTEDAPADFGYKNRSAELWYSGKPLLRSQQIKGIGADMADEMCNRTFRMKPDGKIEIEKKDEMKARTGKSPDIADAGFCCLDVARQKYDLFSVERPKKNSQQEMGQNEFLRWVEQIQGTKNSALEFEG